MAQLLGNRRSGFNRSYTCLALLQAGHRFRVLKKIQQQQLIALQRMAELV